jgi:predicted lipoprotein with Yx(FWY)xxD motif
MITIQSGFRRRLAIVALAAIALAGTTNHPGRAASQKTDGQARATTGSSAKARSKKVLVSTRKIRGLGRVLVDRKGRTLYMFVPDRRKRVTCVSTCAAVWPPLFLPKGGRVVARGRAKATLLRSDRDPAGGRVVTYNGWPLYTYVGDTKPGTATGQALNLNGGLWYVLSPVGKVIHRKAPTA